MNGPTKRCTKCWQTRPIEDFHWADRALNTRRGDCKFCRNAKTKRWYAQNRQRMKKVRRSWYEQHREEHIARVLGARDPEQHRKLQRAYRARPEVLVALRERQAARNINPDSPRESRRIGSFYQEVLDDWGMICHLCDHEITSLSDLHFVHIIPREQGGQHEYGNVLPAHANCSRRKAARLRWANRPAAPASPGSSATAP